LIRESLFPKFRDVLSFSEVSSFDNIGDDILLFYRGILFSRTFNFTVQTFLR